MSDTETTNDSELLKLAPQFDHFDPFAGLVDLHEGESRDIRYGFIICNHQLVFDPALICEVIQDSTVYPIPNTHNWLKGLINLRGNLVPVINLYDYWTIENSNGKLPLIIIGTGDDSFGLYMDAFPKALEIEEDTAKSTDIDDSIPDDLRPYLKHAYQLDNSLWYETDIIAFVRHLTYEYSDDKANTEPS